MHNQFEAVGDMADWPKNVAGKPTQAAVFGLYHPKKGRKFELLWTGKFPDLEPALYWAAKKEIEAVRKGKWMMASRVAWQHDLEPEQAVAVARKQMEPQMNAALKAMRSGGDIDIGDGPMRQIGPNDGAPKYVEIVPNDSDDPIASFIVPADQMPPSMPADLPPDLWAPADPRRSRPHQLDE
jgi:hypothetical protein